MGTFDADSYLRALGERALLAADGSRRHRGRHSPIEQPARALTFVGALDAKTATEVLNDYAVAGAARTGDQGVRFLFTRIRKAPSPGRRSVARRAQPRPFVIGQSLGIGGGILTLDELSVGVKSSTLNYRWVDGERTRRRRNYFPHARGEFPWGNARPTICDNEGNTPFVHGGGGAGSPGGEWKGELVLTGTLAKSLEWIEFEGTRLTLTPSVASDLNRVEPLENETPAARFLWRMMAAADGPFGPDFDADQVLAVLVAAGTMTVGDSLYACVHRTSAALPDNPLHSARIGGPPQPPRALSEQIPERWRSLLARLEAANGPVYELTFSITSPEFDGNHATVAQLSSEETSFTLEVSVAYADRDRDAFDRLPIAWWARDDRGNHYLGAPNGWQSDDESESGTLAFWPALDPSATRLELLIEADTERAVIAIDLPAPSNVASGSNRYFGGPAANPDDGLDDDLGIPF